jgi:hypothetical protein
MLFELRGKNVQFSCSPLELQRARHGADMRKFIAFFATKIFFIDVVVNELLILFVILLTLYVFYVVINNK